MALGTRASALPGLLALMLVCLPWSVRAGPEGSGPSETEAPAATDTPTGPATADDFGPRQQQIADNFRRLQDLLLRMAELTEMTDPRQSALLRKAVRQSEERLIGVQFDSLVRLLEEDRLSRALENQDNLLEDLNALLDLLRSENRARRIESEKARIREYLERLNRIINQQKGIQGRTSGGGEPKPLADEQQKVADKTGDLAQDIKENEESAGGAGRDAQDDDAEKKSGGKPDGSDPPEAKAESQGAQEGKREPGGQSQGPSQGAQEGKREPGRQSQGPSQDGGPVPEGAKPQPQGPTPARQRIEAAQQRMREAREKLEEAQRDGALEKQEQAIQELEQAKADLETILRQLREEEIERTLTMLEARFAKMLQMQREVYEGTQRLDKIPAPQRSHSHEIEASRLSRKEAEIVLGADKALALLRDDGTAVAVPEAVEQVRQDMRQVVRRLDRAQVGPITQTIEEEIIAALEEMVEAFKQARQDADQQRQNIPMPPGPPQDQPLVDLLAEIRMIRAMQLRVNRRTERYSKLVHGEQAESRELLEALGQLAERQQRIHQITRDLQSGKNR